MSKSYKKHPVIKDNGGSKKVSKNLANRRLRARNKKGVEIGDGGSYKKHYEQWDIADYTCRWSKEDAIAFYNDPNVIGGNWARERFDTLEDFLAYWKKEMLGK